MQLADRMTLFDSSGIRKIFDLARQLPSPINLSIGQPHFEVPAPIRQAAIEAIQSRKNGYAVSQGLPELCQRLQERIDAQYGHADRQVLVTSGTSGGLVLALLALVNPGDEVILFDPYFVSYKPLVALAGGKCVIIDTYPDFRIDVNRVRAAVTPRTRAILFNSPANPTGVVATEAEMRDLADLAAQREIALISDEIYSAFCFDQPAQSPAEFNTQTLVVDGFSKTFGVTGWRVGFAHGPRHVIEAMARTQQYTFVCAPQPLQWGSLAGLEVDRTPYIDDYRLKRDRLVDGLSDLYKLERPGGAFYLFPEVPRGKGPQQSATQFVQRAIEHQLLIIPGAIFSARDTHFRVSYAADDATLDRGIAALRAMARAG